MMLNFNNNDYNNTRKDKTAESREVKNNNIIREKELD